MRARLRLPGASVDEAMPDLRGTTDYVGLNYYFRYFVRFAPGTADGLLLTPGPGLVSEIGGSDPMGDSPPEALFLLMREAWRRYGQPIYLTEGGIADEEGTMRGSLIRGQRLAIDRAVAEGIPVKGYLHWTLVDNFEWEKGYRPRFGLYRVDRRTLERTPAGGADVFAELARASRVGAAATGPRAGSLAKRAAAAPDRRRCRSPPDALAAGRRVALRGVVQHEHPVEPLAGRRRRERALALFANSPIDVALPSRGSNHHAFTAVP